MSRGPGLSLEMRMEQSTPRKPRKRRPKSAVALIAGLLPRLTPMAVALPAGQARALLSALPTIAEALDASASQKAVDNFCHHDDADCDNLDVLISGKRLEFRTRGE